MGLLKKAFKAAKNIVKGAVKAVPAAAGYALGSAVGGPAGGMIGASALSGAFGGGGGGGGGSSGGVNYGGLMSNGVGGLVQYYGSKEALDDAEKLADKLSANAQYQPYSFFGPAANVWYDGNSIRTVLPPWVRDVEEKNKSLLGGYFNELEGYNVNDYVSNYVDWMRSVARPYEKRMGESLTSTLFNTGMLGSEAGARQLGEFNRGLSKADLERQIAGETAGLNRFNTMSGAFNTTLKNLTGLWEMPYKPIALGLEAGANRSRAAQIGNNYLWDVGQAQQASKSGLWSNLGNATGNMLGSIFNTSGNAGNYLFTSPDIGSYTIPGYFTGAPYGYSGSSSDSYGYTPPDSSYNISSYFYQ